MHQNSNEWPVGWPESSESFSSSNPSEFSVFPAISIQTTSAASAGDRERRAWDDYLRRSELSRRGCFYQNASGEGFRFSDNRWAVKNDGDFPHLLWLGLRPFEPFPFSRLLTRSYVDCNCQMAVDVRPPDQLVASAQAMIRRLLAIVDAGCDRSTEINACRAAYELAGLVVSDRRHPIAWWLEQLEPVVCRIEATQASQ